MDSESLEILADQNPWWASQARRFDRTPAMRRREFEEVWSRLTTVGPGSRPAVLLMGPRQVGKTTLLQQVANQLLDSGWPGTHLTYCDFEDPRFLRPPTPGGVVEARRAQLGTAGPGEPVFLFDEVHSSPDWSRWLKQLADARAGLIVATDSAAALMRDGSAESGPGRWDEVKVRFLSFPDFHRLRRGGARHRVQAPLDPVVAAPDFDAYLIRGGFPEHVRDDGAARVRERIRTEIADRAIEKDLARAAGLRDTRRVKALFVALAEMSGAIFDASARARDLGVSRQSVDGWVDLLKDTFLLRILPRRARSAAKGLRSHPKVYASDPGLVCAFSRAFDPLGDPRTLGRALETAALRHLDEAAARWDGRLSYYREGSQEADFVLETAAGDFVVEVKADQTPDRRELESFAGVVARFRGGHAVFASRTATERLHRTKPSPVKEAPIWRLLETVSRAKEPGEIMEWCRA